MSEEIWAKKLQSITNINSEWALESEENNASDNYSTIVSGKENQYCPMTADHKLQMDIYKWKEPFK